MFRPATRRVQVIGGIEGELRPRAADQVDAPDVARLYLGIADGNGHFLIVRGRGREREICCFTHEAKAPAAAIEPLDERCGRLAAAAAPHQRAIGRGGEDCAREWVLEVIPALDVVHNCLVVQAGDGPGFAFETLGESAPSYFDGDGAFETRVAGFVDFAHSAGTQRGDDSYGPQPRVCCHEHRPP